MSESIASMVARYRDDFAQVKGKPFEHFYCPILFVDEPAEICRAHVVNKAFKHSSRKCVPQRKDVDGFYGLVAEADFGVLVNCKGRDLPEIMADPELRRKLRPCITVDGKECRHYTYSGHKPRFHTLLRLESDEHEPVDLVLQAPPADVAAGENRDWAVEVEGDYCIPAIASLIKAAHLSLFHICRYEYAFSAAGNFVGRQILGGFYRANCGKPPGEAKAAAREYFSEFANMVRPLEGFEGTPLRGTIDDNTVAVCHGASGRPFAIGVFVRTGAHVNCVLLPEFSHHDSVAAYLDFISNSNEWLSTRLCRFDRAKRRLETDGSDPVRTRWPKGDD